MKPVDVVCILDRSGSMADLVDDSIGGFNTFLAAQKELPGEALFTLVLFDHEYLMLSERIPIKKAEELSKATYVPRGRTALLDAIGKTIKFITEKRKTTGEVVKNRMSVIEVDSNLKEEKHPTAVIAILTDGLENASKNYKKEDIKKLIEEKENQEGWKFVFLSADMAAISEAQSFGVASQNTMSFAANSQGVQKSYGIMGQMVASYRTGSESMKVMNQDGEWENTFPDDNDKKGKNE